MSDGGSTSAYGHWWDPAFPSEKISGQLMWEPLRAPRLSLLEPPPDFWRRSHDATGRAVPMLHGRLANWAAVTLLDCTWSGMNIGASLTQMLRLDTVLMGVWLKAPDEVFIRRVKVRWPALRAMLGDYAISFDRLPSRRMRQIRFKIDPKRLEWSDGDIAVSFEYDFPLSSSPTSATVEAAPVVLLTSTRPWSYQWWRKEWLVPLNDFMVIVTGIKSNPQSMRLWERKNLRRDGSDVPIGVVSQGVGDHDYRPDKGAVLVTASDLRDQPKHIHDVLRRFKELKEQHPVFLELLIDVANYPDRPLRNRYLDVVSSLEAYHTQEHGLGPIDEANYKERRKNILEATGSAGLSASDTRFLKRWLAPRSSFSLENRLRDLAKGSSSHARWKVSPEGMAKLRNSLAHGNAGIAEEELQDAYDQAFVLGRRTVLHRLGL
jgi:hypothetical protein